MRSTMISRCSSPMPEISVCPVSGSVDTRKVGSSCASRCMATPSLSWSALVRSDDDFQVQLAHAGDQRLPGIRFGGHAKSGIFLREPLHGHAQLVLVGFSLGLNGDGNDGRREIDGFENDLLLLVAQSVAGIYALEAHTSADIPCVDFVDFFTLVGVHLQQAADTLAGALCRVVNVASGFQDAGIYADVGDMPDERVGHNFERQSRKRLVIGGAAKFGFLVIRIDAL